jgi:hypothetical protein
MSCDTLEEESEDLKVAEDRIRTLVIKQEEVSKSLKKSANNTGHNC